MREESAHLLGEEKGDQCEDQETRVDGVVDVSSNGVLAESLQNHTEEAKDHLQQAQKSIAVIAVKSHSPYLLSRMTEDDDEEDEVTLFTKDPVVDYVPCNEPLSSDLLLKPEHITSTPSLVTVDMETDQSAVVVEKVNEEALVQLETGHQTQPKLEERTADDQVRFGGCSYVLGGGRSRGGA